MSIKQEAWKIIQSAFSLVENNLQNIHIQKTIIDSIPQDKANEDELIKAKFYLNDKISLLLELNAVLENADAECQRETTFDSYMEAMIKRIMSLSKQFKTKQEDEYFNSIVNKFIESQVNNLNF